MSLTNHQKNAAHYCAGVLSVKPEVVSGYIGMLDVMYREEEDPINIAEWLDYLENHFLKVFKGTPLPERSLYLQAFELYNELESLIQEVSDNGDA